MRVLIVLLFLLPMSIQNALTDIMDRQLILTFLGQCKGKDNLPVYLPDFKVEQANRHQYYMTGDIVIRENFPKGFNLLIDVKKCSSPSIADSCKTFLNNMATTDICTMLDIPLPSYSTFVRSLNPPFKCPLRETTYHIDNFTVEDSLTRYMPVSRSVMYWNVTLRGRLDKREVACLNIQMHARPVSKQSRRN